MKHSFAYEIDFTWCIYCIVYHHKVSSAADESFGRILAYVTNDRFGKLTLVPTLPTQHPSPLVWQYFHVRFGFGKVINFTAHNIIPGSRSLTTITSIFKLLIGSPHHRSFVCSFFATINEASEREREGWLDSLIIKDESSILFRDVNEFECW